MDREIELKFLIPPEAAEAILGALDGEGAVRQLDATYYDTADHALRRAGFGLRVRDGEGGRKQTLKSAFAGGVFSRGEWEEKIAGPAPDRDALARTPVAQMLAEATLSPVFTTRVERVIRMVRSGETLIEVALDRGQLSAGERHATVCELELELKTGEPAALFDLARTLARHAPLRLSLISKAERGYGLAAGEAAAAAAVRRPALALSPDASVGEALQAIGQAGLGHLCAALEALRERPEPEGVHQTRIAARRLRALLKIFKPLSRDAAARALNAELDWLAGELDAARDLDVFAGEVWEATTEPFEGRDAFDRGLKAARANAYLRMEAALESPRARDVLLDAAAWLEAGAWTNDPALAALRESPAAAFAAEQLDRLRRRVKKAAKRFDDLDARARHRLRLKGKTLRYAAEDLAPLFPEHAERADRFVKAAKAAQDTLGALNDRSVREGLVDLAAHGDADLSRAAQRVVLGDEERDLLAAARDALKDLLDAKPFW